MGHRGPGGRGVRKDTFEFLEYMENVKTDDYRNALVVSSGILPTVNGQRYFHKLEVYNGEGAVTESKDRLTKKQLLSHIRKYHGQGLTSHFLGTEEGLQRAVTEALG